MSEQTWAELVGATDRELSQLGADLERWLYLADEATDEVRLGTQTLAVLIDRVASIRRPLTAALARPAEPV